MVKSCTKCRTKKPTEDFYKSKTTKDRRSYVCKSCESARAKTPERKAAGRKSSRRFYHECPIGDFLYRKAISGSHRSGVEITPAFAKAAIERQGWKCYYTGVQMEDVRGQNHPLAPTLDRVDSSLGYTPDNVVICSWIANRMKGDLSEAKFHELLNRIADSVFGKRWSTAA